jgi:WD40 repeat protein
MNKHTILFLAANPTGTDRLALDQEARAISASEDDTLKIWELSSGRVLVTRQVHRFGLIACAVTPDGKHLVSSTYDSAFKVSELTTGRVVATLSGHTDIVNACVVTPDGQHVISASNDHTLRVWDLATFTCRITHRGDARYTAVAVSATTVVAGDATGAVWFLDLPPVARSPSPPVQTPPALVGRVVATYPVRLTAGASDVRHRSAPSLSSTASTAAA